MPGPVIPQTAGDLDPAAWPLGGIATRDVITPVPFVSVDPEEEAQLKAQAIASVTPIYRHVPTMVDSVRADFEALVTESRLKFTAATTTEFGPLPLDAKTFLNEEFEGFLERWAIHEPEAFPPSLELARVWAMELDDTPALHAWREVLRSLMSDHLICDAPLHQDAAAPAALGRMVACRAPDELLTSEYVAQRATSLDLSRLWTLAQAKEELARRMETSAPATAVVSSLLRANTYADIDLAERERIEHAMTVRAPRHVFVAGAVLVRQGDVIGPGEHAALEALRARLAEAPVAEVESRATPPPAGPAAAAPGGPVSEEVSYPLFLHRILLPGALLTGTVLALLIAWRRSRAMSRATIVIAQSRLMKTESPVVRALRDTTVQHLYTHRQILLEDQEKGAEKVTDIEARVARLQPQFEARIQSYEGRIKELEAMLSARPQVPASRTPPDSPSG